MSARCACTACVRSPEDWYAWLVCDDRPSIALSLLALWERPWSGNALRFAAHALQRVARLGIDVLEQPLPDR